MLQQNLHHAYTLFGVGNFCPKYCVTVIGQLLPDISSIPTKFIFLAHTYFLVTYEGQFVLPWYNFSQTIKATFTQDWIRSDPFGIRSTMVRILCVYTGPDLNWNGKVPHRITFVSGPIWYQIADPIRTRSTRSRVNTRVPNGSGPV